MNTFNLDGIEGDSAPHQAFNSMALQLPEFAALSRERRRQHGAARRLDDARRADLRAAKEAARRELESTQREPAPVVPASVTEARDHKIRLKRKKASGAGSSADGKHSIFRFRKRPAPKLAR